MSQPEASADTVEHIQRFSRRWLKERFPLREAVRGYTGITFRADMVAARMILMEFVGPKTK